MFFIFLEEKCENYAKKGILYRISQIRHPVKNIKIWNTKYLGLLFILFCFNVHKVRWIKCSLNYTNTERTLPSYFHRSIYQNYSKISWSTKQIIYSVKSPLDSTVASSRLRNLLQLFCIVFLFKLVNACHKHCLHFILGVKRRFIGRLLNWKRTHDSQMACSLEG